jgi:hypothetical protein
MAEQSNANYGNNYSFLSVQSIHNYACLLLLFYTHCILNNDIVKVLKVKFKIKNLAKSEEKRVYVFKM